MSSEFALEWEPYEGLAGAAAARRLVAEAPFNAGGRRPRSAPPVAVRERLDVDLAASMSTQQGFGLIMHGLAKLDGDFADRIVTTSPDVTVSTNLGARVNRRCLFARESLADTFKADSIPSDCSAKTAATSGCWRSRRQTC